MPRPMPRSLAPPAAYGPRKVQPLPFRFERLGDGRYLLSNLVGDYLLVDRSTLERVVQGSIRSDDPAYPDLRARHFVFDGASTASLELLAAQYRTRQRLLPELTALHILVVTLRCNSSCIYCHASRRQRDESGCDMSAETAEAALRFAFQSPSKTLKIEFQGGEPLLRSDLIEHAMASAERLRAGSARAVDFVICSNLALLDAAMLRRLASHDVYFSTSLDGPKALHDRNRPTPSRDGYEATVRGIRLIQREYGRDRVSALLTLSQASLDVPEEIVDEYVRLELPSVFVRELNPYGLAAQSSSSLHYELDDWFVFYKRVLAYTIHLTLSGVPIREEYSALLLRRMLTSHATGFVDLQSPTGSALSVMAYDFDGSIYVSDEGRMLAAMGDYQFKIGHVEENSFSEVITSPAVLDLVSETMCEVVPGCSDCAYLPWCGSDPVRHYRTQGDVVGHKPTSDWCRKNMMVMQHLITLLDSDPAAARVLRQWAFE